MERMVVVGRKEREIGIKIKTARVPPCRGRRHQRPARPKMRTDRCPGILGAEKSSSRTNCHVKLPYMERAVIAFVAEEMQRPESHLFEQLSILSAAESIPWSPSSSSPPLRRYVQKVSTHLLRVEDVVLYNFAWQVFSGSRRFGPDQCKVIGAAIHSRWYLVTMEDRPRYP